MKQPLRIRHGKLSCHIDGDYPGPQAVQLARIAHRRHVGDFNTWHTGRPGGGGGGHAGHRRQYPERRGRRADHHRIAGAGTHAESRNVEHRHMVHDIGRRHAPGHHTVERQHGQRPRRRAKTALQKWQAPEEWSSFIVVDLWFGLLLVWLAPRPLDRLAVLATTAPLAPAVDRAALNVA